MKIKLLLLHHMSVTQFQFPALQNKQGYLRSGLSRINTNIKLHKYKTLSKNQHKYKTFFPTEDQAGKPRMLGFLNLTPFSLSLLCSICGIAMSNKFSPNFASLLFASNFFAKCSKHKFVEIFLDCNKLLLDKNFQGHICR